MLLQVSHTIEVGTWLATVTLGVILSLIGVVWRQNGSRLKATDRRLDEVSAEQCELTELVNQNATSVARTQEQVLATQTLVKSMLTEHGKTQAMMREDIRGLVARVDRVLESRK